MATTHSFADLHVVKRLAGDDLGPSSDRPGDQVLGRRLGRLCDLRGRHLRSATVVDTDAAR